MRKKRVKNGILRGVITALAIVLQIGWIVFAAYYLEERVGLISVVAGVVAVVAALYMFGRNSNSAYKLPWLFLILAFPIFGVILYFATGHSAFSRRRISKYKSEARRMQDKLFSNRGALERSRNFGIQKSILNQYKYVEHHGQYPLYDDSDIDYFPDSAIALESMIEDMNHAKQFIMLEYHAIEVSEAFRRVEEVLARKASEGVEVRIIYDDVGSIGFIDIDFVQRMKKNGIECRVFNPMRPFINGFINNRDHRKITVIDGCIGYTGGFNLADEYFNLVSPYGYWKDSAVRIEGRAVETLSALFIEMWNGIAKSTDDIERFFLPRTRVDCKKSQSEGLVQPYGDSPLDKEYVAENIYINMINAAEDYVWFSTPYLIIDDEMKRALSLAAAKGVDVRIIIPSIPDKKLVYKVTNSYASSLSILDIKIYKYKPGFNHSKLCLTDDKIACCGTVNLDYRSLFLHFENGVLFSQKEAIHKVKNDMEEMFKVSENVSDEYRLNSTRRNRLLDSILRLMAPLL